MEDKKPEGEDTSKSLANILSFAGRGKVVTPSELVQENPLIQEDFYSDLLEMLSNAGRNTDWNPMWDNYLPDYSEIAMASQASGTFNTQECFLFSIVSGGYLSLSDTAQLDSKEFTRKMEYGMMDSRYNRNSEDRDFLKDFKKKESAAEIAKSLLMYIVKNRVGYPESAVMFCKQGKFAVLPQEFISRK